MSMDCNKDEAIRAKEFSEKKMANNDFEGARNIALKAQKLFPALENITQLLSTCDVHCSAQKRIIGTEKDWYAILQIDRSADDSIIKKQYRRLALILHPDKNRLPGAEAAFKLISEANAILSDSIKKSMYDNKIRVFAPTNPPPHHMNRNFNINQQSGFRTNITNGFGNLNQHKAEIILTFCPFCKTKYQCHREHVNKSLRCKTCSKPFMACETSGQGVPKSGQPSAQVPLKPGFSQPAVFHEKVVLNQGCSKVGVQNGKGSSVSHENASTKPVQPEPGIKIGSNSESNPVASAFSGNGDMKDNGTFTNKKGGNESRYLEKNRKRGRKMVVDSSESDSDLESDSGDDSHGNAYECPDTEFYDFEKERDGSPFKVGQIWACYDDSDGMPRFYAKVTKASSFPFQVSFRWLEAVSINETDKNLVVGCGTFKLGSKIEKRSKRNMFSHQMTNCLPGKKRGSFTIYPEKGEIWALSKKRDPENNKEFKCEIVEVLSDFVDGVGLTVCYMDKVDGFVSVFQKATGSESFMIGEDELYKFSHRVPSFKLDGSEKDGVPRGSFEFDPASLPSNPDDLHFPGKAKKKSGEMDCGVHCSPPKPAEVKNPLKFESKNVFIDLDDE